MASLGLNELTHCPLRDVVVILEIFKTILGTDILGTCSEIDVSWIEPNWW